MSKKLFYLVSFVLLVGLVGTGTAQNIDPSLVGWWTFEDGSGTVAKDLSGNGADATLFNGPTWSTEAGHGGILLFDGVDDYAFIDGSYQVPVYTITVWFRVEGGSAERDIFSAYAPGVQHGILLEIRSEGVLRYLHRYPLGTGGGTNIYTTTTYDDGAWYHAAMVKSVDTIALYINGEEVDSAADTSEFNPGDTFGMALGILDNEREPQRHFPGAIDDVRIYDRPMSQEEIQVIMQAEPWPYAWGPDPADGAIYENTWVNLGWLPGAYAVSHDVYLGENFDDVNDGTAETFRGNQPLTSTTLFTGFIGYPYPDGLVPGTTYYWRIDEVNDADPNSPWKGDVWSFLVPPMTAYDPNPAYGAKFIDPNVELNWTVGFGAGLHYVYFGDNFDDVNSADMALHQADTTYTPGTLEVDKTYYWRVDEFDFITTHKGDVWSFTTAGAGGGVRADYYIGMNFGSHVLTRTDPQINFNWGGAPDEALGEDNFSVRWTGEVEAAFTETYTFYTNSNDGVRLWVDDQQLVDNWTDHENTENSGNIDLAAGQTYSVVMEYYENDGVAVAELRWSSPRTPKQLIPQGALSLLVRASRSNPSNGAVDIKQTPILSWQPGDYADTHDVYFGTGSPPAFIGNQAATSYDPGKLEWDTTYYWRVDEVNNLNPDSPWAGNVWSFTTADFLIVEDFEDYNDFEPDTIFDTWLDGWNVDTNGSEVGYAEPDFPAGEHFVETNIVHGGSQSMPYFYDNNFKYSEATYSPTQRDWTEEDVGVLSLWFRGSPVGFVEGPAGTYTMSGAGTDIWDTADEFRYAYKQLSGDGEIVAQVLSVENTNVWAKAGVMIRESLDPGSKHAFVCITPGNGKSFQNRKQTDLGSSNSNTTGFTAPYWVKLVRQGNQFTGYHSEDGVNWVLQAANTETANPETVSMATNVYIGLALTSHNSGVTCVAEFSDVETTGAVTPLTWTHEAIGATMAANDPAPMYVALNGSAGVYHDNSNAPLIDTWTEWTIDLQEFIGVNLTNVNTIAIGFGDKNNLQAGGSGLVFFDDIRLYRPAPEPETQP